MISQDIINKMNAIKAAQQVKADKPQATFNARQEAEKPKEDKPKEYDNLQDITQAANSGQLISLSNLSNLVNLDKRPRKDAEPTPPPTPQAQPETVPNLDYFTILWHEGHHVPNFENTIFTNWDTIQEAFLKLWEVNEKGQDGGYTKVKCKIKLTGKAEFITRVDITNRIGNGDFNPSDEHITHYLIDAIEAAEAEETTKDTVRPELSNFTIDTIFTEAEQDEPTQNAEAQQQPTAQPEPATVTPQPFKIERYTPEPTTNPQPLQIVRYKPETQPEPQPEPQPEKVTAIVRENKLKKGIEIIFSSKPKDSILEALRDNNWRYSKFQNLWYNLMSEDAVKFAKNLNNL